VEPCRPRKHAHAQRSGGLSNGGWIVSLTLVAAQQAGCGDDGRPQGLIGRGVFVVLHYLYGYGWNTGYLLVALALGWVFLRTGSILPGVVLHAASNRWFAASSHGRHVLGDAAILDWLCGR
jgi:hypothetical protein